MWDACLIDIVAGQILWICKLFWSILINILLFACRCTFPLVRVTLSFPFPCAVIMDSKEPTKKMSDFERKRQANIQTNRALLTDISTTTAAISAPKPTTQFAARKTRQTPRNAETPTRVQPLRQSSRIKGLAADDDSLKRKYEADVKFAREKDRAKRTRVSGDLALNDISISGSRWDGGVGGLKSLQLRGAQPGVRTWEAKDVKNEDEDSEDTKDVSVEAKIKSLMKRLNKLKLYEKWEPNGTLNGLYPPTKPCRRWY